MSAMLSKLASEKNARELAELAIQPGNDVCADCKVRNPRWASHNLGIFLCMNCASIHRKIGTHITKVKSLTMDTWTKEQVDNMKNMGNRKSNSIYNPNETRHPPPPNLEDGERDSEMEQYIRSKYEYRKFMDRSALAASKLGPSRSASSVASAPRSASSPLAPSTSRSSTLPPSSSSGSSLGKSPLSSSETKPPTQPSRPSLTQPSRSVSQPVAPPPAPAQQQPQQQPQGGVWNDLIQLQDSKPVSHPLQYSQQPPPSANVIPQSTGLGLMPSGMASPMFTGSQVASHPTGFGNPFQQASQPQFTPSGASFPFTSQQPSQPMTPQSSFGQQLFMSHTGMSLPMGGSTPGVPGSAQSQVQFFQPTPQNGSTGLQAPQGYTGSPSPSISVPLSAPANQTGFATPSPNPQLGFMSHSPQPQQQLYSLTPSPSVGMGGVGMMHQPSHSPAPMQVGMPTGQFGVGMSMGGGMQQPLMQMHTGQPNLNGMGGNQFLQGLPAGMLSPANYQAGQQSGFSARNPFAQM